MTRRGGPAGMRGSFIDPYKPAIDRIVDADAGSPKRRSVRLICEELGIPVASRSAVDAYVSSRRRGLRQRDLQGSRPA